MSEVVFIDSRVVGGTALQSELMGLGYTVYMLNTSSDGIAQMSSALTSAAAGSIDGIHIVGLGYPGAMQLGSGTFNAAAVASNGAALGALGAKMAAGKGVFLYGSHTGFGATGQTFADNLATAMGHTVQASDDALVPGDWDMETTSASGGAITNAAFTTALVSSLAAAQIDGTAGSDTLVGTNGNDIINGLGSADTLDGGNGNDTIDGGTGSDAMTGGTGDDTFVVDDGGDAVSEGVGAGTDLVKSSISYVLGSNVENLTLTGTTAINATGNTEANTLTGNDGNNVLDGVANAAGHDTMDGGKGDDTYKVYNVGDVVAETTSGGGTDTVHAFGTASITLGANIENLILEAGAADGTGNALANALTGNAAANVLDGGAGADTMTGGDGNDTYVVDSSGDTITETGASDIDTVKTSLAAYTLGATLENLDLTGSAAADGTGNAAINTITGNNFANVLSGAAGDDTLVGNDGSDTLNGGEGADSMNGGAGDDLYEVDNAGDTVADASGTDKVRASVSFDMSGLAIEDLELTGTAANGTGNALANKITGNAAANALVGGDGADTLDGGAGNDDLTGGIGDDTFVVDAAGDVLHEAAGEGTDLVKATANVTLNDGAAIGIDNVTLLGTAAINATGNSLNNILTGNDAANLLDGAGGNDTLVGGKGDDTYTVDAAGDIVTESSDSGSDTIRSGLALIDLANYANVENVTLTGAGAATGGAGVNRLTGSDAVNTLDGKAGADIMSGGGGNDTYMVDDAEDVVTEGSSTGGTDTVNSSVSYVLGTNVENLVLATGTAALNGTGNAAVNTLTGNDGANVLDGKAGDDILSGGAGADTYVVDSALDSIVGEAATVGEIDRVNASFTYTLAANLENLDLTGGDAIDGTGNAAVNTLWGNGNDNTLNGLAGADTMKGGDGSDIYVVDDAGDVVSEGKGDALDVDTVRSSVSYTLGDNIERLMLTGSATIDATGNAAANALIGNSANNTLDGMGGDDAMSGGGGNDTYVVDSAGDRVRELSDDASQIDTVVSSAGTFKLGANLEVLILAGSAASNGSGNGLGNSISGNDAVNRLFGDSGIDELLGGGGNDVLNGGSGSDELTGGAGSDTFKFANKLVATNVDQILDFAHGSDRIAMDNAVFKALGKAGALKSSQFHAGTEAADANDRIVYDKATGKLWYDADGNGSGAAVQFAEVSDGTNVTASDLWIV